MTREQCKDCQSLGLDMRLIGLSIKEAERLSELMIREGEKDGEQLMLTCEFSPDRINVATENGLITRIISRG